MKNLLLTLVILIGSITAWSNTEELSSKTCDTKIAMTVQNYLPYATRPMPPVIISDWFVDVTGARPTGWFNWNEKTKYDSIRPILDKGYKLSQAMDADLDLASTKEGDLLISMKFFCSSDAASAFCSTSAEVYQAVVSENGALVSKIVFAKASPKVTEGASEMLYYNSVKTISTLLPKCIVK